MPPLLVHDLPARNGDAMTMYDLQVALESRKLRLRAFCSGAWTVSLTGDDTGEAFGGTAHELQTAIRRALEQCDERRQRMGAG